MEKESISKKLARFNWCDKRFYPYIEKVLMRLPEEVCFDRVLNDLNLDIVSFEKAVGVFYPLTNSIKKLIVLNGAVLKKPDFQIIHTIAHEIAHKIIEKGESGLYEKEAEELLVQWGFQEEVEKADYTKTWLEGGGYKVGYEWAEKQKDLSEFEEFYDEWNEGELDPERWDELFHIADPLSIAAEMGVLGEPIDTSKIPEPENAVVDLDGSHDRGIVHGIMKYLKEKKQRALGRVDKAELTQSERDELFWMILREVWQKSERLHDNRIHQLTWEYSEKYPEIKAFTEAIMGIGELLEELDQKGGEPD